jgi:peptidoglycan/xylan/chitin deacetylase (PgdA/CDA1 family)
MLAMPPGRADVPGSRGGVMPACERARAALFSSAPRLLPSALTRIPGVSAIALTFDDGPSVETAALLDALDAEALRATFFVSGAQIAGREAVLRSITERGHAVANHSFAHESLLRTPPDAIRESLLATQRAVFDACGASCTHFRPPYGRWNPQRNDILDELGLRLTLWSCMPAEYLSGMTDADIERTLHHRARAGAIIVLHDNAHCGARSRKALPSLARLLRERSLQTEFLPTEGKALQ